MQTCSFQLPEIQTNENRHENMCKCVTKQSNCKFNVSLATPTSQFSKALKCINIYKANNPLFKFKHRKKSQGGTFM